MRRSNALALLFIVWCLSYPLALRLEQRNMNEGENVMKESLLPALGSGALGAASTWFGGQVALLVAYPQWAGALIGGSFGLLIALVNLFGKWLQIRHERQMKRRKGDTGDKSSG